MTRKTELMRVPREFKTEIMRISKKRNIPATDFLRKDCIRIIKDAEFITNMLFSNRGRR